MQEPIYFGDHTGREVYFGENEDSEFEQNENFEDSSLNDKLVYGFTEGTVEQVCKPEKKTEVEEVPKVCSLLGR